MTTSSDTGHSMCFERYIHSFVNVLNFCESHAPQMTRRCLNKPERYPLEPIRWPHMKRARCGNAMIPLSLKLTDMQM